MTVFYDPISQTRLYANELADHAYVMDQAGVFFQPVKDERTGAITDWERADSATQNLLFDRFFPTGGGDTYHPPAWRPGEQQLERDRLNAEIAGTQQRLQEIGIQEQGADRRQREQLAAEKEMLLLNLDNSKRELLYSEIGATGRTLISEQGATKRQLLTLGPDPFTQGAALRGQVQRGVTPQQAAIGQAQAFINQPLPQVGINAPIPEMEEALQSLQQLQAPQMGGWGVSSGAFGMAKGGIIEMEHKDGAFSMRPKQSFLVGEEGPEVLTVGGGKVEVTPFSGGAQGGLSFTRSSLQALAPLYSGLGFTGVPTARWNPRAGAIQARQVGTESGARGGMNVFSRLGIQPQLIKRPGSRTVFYLEGNTLRPIPSIGAFNQMGFQPGQVTEISQRQFQGLGRIGEPLTRIGEEPVPTGTPAFQAMGAPLVEPNSGAILPAPFRIARVWNLLRPDQQLLFEDAYSKAGLSREALYAQVAAATPAAGAFGGRRIAFGGYI